LRFVILKGPIDLVPVHISLQFFCRLESCGSFTCRSCTLPPCCFHVHHNLSLTGLTFVKNPNTYINMHDCYSPTPHYKSSGSFPVQSTSYSFRT